MEVCTYPSIDLAAAAAAIERHPGGAAFQFSGGRDSTAALYALRDFWPQLRVYHLDTGDQFPETRAVVDKVSRDVEIVRIEGNVAAVREAFGWPSDLVPSDNTTIGQMLSGREVRLQQRIDCCARSLMNPMHQRMIEDGMTLLIRGQRDDEFHRAPLRSGAVIEGFEVLYPIQSWSADDVMAFIRANDLPVAPYYEAGMTMAPECMHCTAWWNEGRAKYLRDNHPAEHAVLIERLGVIKREIDRQFATLQREVAS